jgi:hypothetical protein
MTDEYERVLLNRYRESVEDIASPTLDRLVESAAARQAARNQLSRRVRETALLAAFASVALGLAWQIHRSSSHTGGSAGTDFGKIEGFSTPYLLQAGAQQYSGPGTTEGAT